MEASAEISGAAPRKQLTIQRTLWVGLSRCSKSLIIDGFWRILKVVAYDFWISGTTFWTGFSRLPNRISRKLIQNRSKTRNQELIRSIVPYSVEFKVPKNLFFARFSWFGVTLSQIHNSHTRDSERWSLRGWSLEYWNTTSQTEPLSFELLWFPVFPIQEILGEEV